MSDWDAFPESFDEFPEETKASVAPEDTRGTLRQAADLGLEFGASAVESAGSLASMINPSLQGPSIAAGSKEAAESIRSVKSTFAQDRAKRQEEALKKSQDDSFFSGLKERMNTIMEAPGEAGAKLLGGMAIPLTGGGILKGVGMGAKAIMGGTAGLSGGIGAGSVRENYYKEIQGTPDAKLIAENPAYAAMRAKGIDEKQAKELTAMEVSNGLAAGMALQGAIDAVATVWGGAEKSLLTGTTKGFKPLAKTTAKESTGETVSGSNEVLQSNLAVQEKIPSTPALKGVGTGGVEGGVLGGVAGSGAHIISSKGTPAPKVDAVNADLEAFKQKAAQAKVEERTASTATVPMYPENPADPHPVMVEVSTDSRIYKDYVKSQEVGKNYQQVDPATGQQPPADPNQISLPLPEQVQQPAVEKMPGQQGELWEQQGPPGPPEGGSPTQPEQTPPSAPTGPANGTPAVQGDLFQTLPNQPLPADAMPTFVDLIKEDLKDVKETIEDRTRKSNEPHSMPRYGDTGKVRSTLLDTMRGKPVQQGYARLAKTATNPKLGYIFERLSALIDTMSKQGIEVRAAGETNLKVNGIKAQGAMTPDFRNNRVFIRYDVNQLSDRALETVLAHEGIHATTGALIEANKDPEWRKANPQLSAKITELDNLFQTVKSKVRTMAVDNDLMRYMTSNLHEFVAYGLTEPEVIRALKATPVPQGSNMFMEMIRKIGNLLGFRPNDFNLYAELISIFDSISRDPNINSVYKGAFKAAKRVDVHAAYERLTGMSEYESMDVQTAIKEMRERPWDIDKSRTGQLLRSGIRHLAIATNHPMIKATHTAIDKAFSEKRNELRRIMGKGDSLLTRLNSVPKEERNLVRQILNIANDAQTDIDVNDFPSLSKAAKDFIQKNQEELRNVLDYHNDKALLSGNKLITPREGYSPAYFTGRFRAIVTIMTDGRQHPVGFVGERTQKDFDKAMEWVRKNHPEAKITNLPKPKAVANKDLEDIASITELVREALPTVDESLLEALRMMDNQLFGMDKREKGKLGVWGSDGNKPWADDNKNTTEFYDALFRYYDEAYTHAALQPAKKDIRAMNQEFQEQAPNAKFEIEAYMQHATGHNLNNAGALANNIVDNIMSTIDNSVGGNSSKGAMILRDQLTTLALGWFNTQYLAAQLIQPFQTAMPFAKLVTHRYGISSMHIAKSMANSGMQYAAYVAGMKTTPDVTKIINFAEANGLAGMSHLEHSSAINKNAVNRKIDALGQGVIQAGEKLTRLPMFLMFTDMIRSSPQGQLMELDKILDLAKNLTQYSMVDYNPEQRPQLYSELGYAGSLLGTFRTYQHGNISQMKTLGKEALKGGDAMPIFMMLGVLLLLGGTMGMPLVEEAESMFKLAGANITPKQAMLKYLPPEVSKGALSEVTGFDLSSKYAMNAIIPNQFPMAHVNQVWKPLVAAYELINNDILENGVISPQAAKNVVREALPASAKNIFDTYANVDEEKMVLRGRNNTASVDLTKEDLDKRKSLAGWVTQAKPNKETMRRQIDFENSYINLQNAEAQAKIKSDLKRYLGQDMLSASMLERMAETYVKKGGNPSQFLKGLDEYMRDKDRPPILRGLERGKVNQKKLQALDNKYRE